MIFITSNIIDVMLPPRMPNAPKAAEEVQRPAHVFQQESDRQQVEEHAEGAPDTIMALAPLAVHVADRNLADRCAIPTRQRGNEAVHLAVKRNALVITSRRYALKVVPKS